MVGRAEPISIGPEERRERLDYLQISDADRVALRELKDFFVSIAGEMMEVFYEHVLTFPGSAKFLKDPGLLDRLKGAQREHFLGLAEATHDDDYFESRISVGLAHARVGVEPKWYLGGYNVQLQFLLSRMLAEYGHDLPALGRYMSAITKAVILDMSLAVDAYILSGYVERSLADAYYGQAEEATRALAEKAAEQRRREQMTEMVVHDIRSPVTSVIATARAARRKYPDDSQAPGRQFALIEKAATGLLAIVDDARGAWTIEDGDLPVRTENVDLGRLIRDCVNEIVPFAHQSQHTIEFDAGADAPHTEVDPVLLHRILSNLLVNAVRHTPSGVRVNVSCQARSDGGVTICVRDDGPGLPRRVVERLVSDPAQDPHDASSSLVGSGLGLRFCKLACARLGGRLEVDRAASGACFLIQLPVAESG